MTCPNCSATHSLVIQNYRTCTSCGTMFEYEPKYVQGYSSMQQRHRKQYYSRIKRFAKKLKEMKNDVIGKHTYDILTAYGLLEFGWNMTPRTKRKYFYSQKVVLFFILKNLEIDVEVPVLKNKDRTLEQIDAMKKIVAIPGLL